MCYLSECFLICFSALSVGFFYPSDYVVFAHTLSYINWELICILVKLKISFLSPVFFLSLNGRDDSETSLSSYHSKELRENKKEYICKKEIWVKFH